MAAYPQLKTSRIASSAAAFSAPNPNIRLKGLTLKAGSDAATAIVYDNTSGSGTVLFELTAVANTSADVFLPTDVYIAFENGAYVALTGTSSSSVLYYEGS